MSCSEWNGRLEGQREPQNILPLSSWVPNLPPGEGGSRPLPALGSDGERYWVKHRNNPQGGMVLVNEQIVGQCGALIGAPTCEVRVVRIVDSMEGEHFGMSIESGLAHGSKHLPDAMEHRRLLYREDDDNRRRHAGVLAVVLWCWGRDLQWMFQGPDHETHSHDHGWYFPKGTEWNSHLGILEEHFDTIKPPGELGLISGSGASYGIDQDALMEYACRLNAVTGEQIAEVLKTVPDEWPVESHQLEALGCFLERRTARAAEYLERLTTI